MLAKIHRDGHHWASADTEAGTRPHPSKNAVIETPSEGLNTFKISPMPKNVLNIHKRFV